MRTLLILAVLGGALLAGFGLRFWQAVPEQGAARVTSPLPAADGSRVRQSRASDDPAEQLARAAEKMLRPQGGAPPSRPAAAIPVTKTREQARADMLAPLEQRSLDEQRELIARAIEAKERLIAAAKESLAALEGKATAQGQGVEESRAAIRKLLVQQEAELNKLHERIDAIGKTASTASP